MGFSADRGKPLFEIDLKSAPVYEGMAAAAGKVFLSLKDGHVACFDSP